MMTVQTSTSKDDNPLPHANGRAPKSQDETPGDTPAVTIAYTPLAEVRRANAPGAYVPLPVELSNLTDEVLAALNEGARAELHARKAKREADFFALVTEQAKLLGVTPARLAAVLAGKAPASRLEDAVDGRKNPKPLFWNPKDHAQRWTKKGNKPKWFDDCLKEGITEEEMRIPEGAV
jgi:DNA-binding protein H-NS